MRSITTLIILSSFLIPISVHAQEIHQDIQGVWKASVTEVVSEKTETIPGTDTPHTVQTLRAEILEGEKQGDIITFENDYITLKKGDRFFLNYLITIHGDELYSVREIDRRGSLVFFILLFIAVIIAFGGKQGVRSLIALTATFIAIVYILLPLLLKGYSPVLVSSGIAALVLACVIYFTHGINRESHAAFLGTVSAVALSSVLAYVAISVTRLTGFSSDESVYLNFNTGGMLDFGGLLLGGIIIGALGVLDDIAVTQAAVVHELYSAGHDAGTAHSPKYIFKKALRIGREHVGALVNTLALAYAGTSLPLILLISMSPMPFGTVINQELFATEIIRTIVGSIGLVLAVPITTLLAVYLLKNHRSHKSSHGHTHSH